ncbi:hypothetical protein GCM10010166_65880 [Couchioplanes caeruleus subsp. azureus]|nr:hypothetical protein GCM10010166_65880 [Couchioplanes caeruleus subsp. azureus]
MLVKAAALARQAVLQAGFPAEGLRPLRVDSNAVFLLPRLRVVVRVRVTSSAGTAVQARGSPCRPL